MISDDKLRAFVDITASDVEKDEFASSSIRHTFLHALCKELLAYREAERKTKSWDDTEAWVQTRRKLNYPALKDGDSCFTEDSFTHRSYD